MKGFDQGASRNSINDSQHEKLSHDTALVHRRHFPRTCFVSDDGGLASSDGFPAVRPGEEIALVPELESPKN